MHTPEGGGCLIHCHLQLSKVVRIWFLFLVWLRFMVLSIDLTILLFIQVSLWNLIYMNKVHSVWV